MLKSMDKRILEILDKEKNRQASTIELIASENFASDAVMELAGSVFTNKYAEGYPGKRYYNGCDHMDEVENLAIEGVLSEWAIPDIQNIDAIPKTSVGKIDKKKLREMYGNPA